MDLRERKTRRSIHNAFLDLRREKPLERITIKELAARAEIIKATFYLHYQDIYDLSEQMQEEVIRRVLGSITHPELCLTDRKRFTEELFYAFYGEQSLIEILFSGTQSQILPMRLEKELQDFIKKHDPRIDKRTEMSLTYTICGGYAVYQKYYRNTRPEEIISLVSDISAKLHPIS